VSLPERLVSEALSATPEAFEYYDLDGNAGSIKAGSIADNVGTYSEAVNWLDYQASQLRPSTLADLRTAVRVADALDVVTGTGVIVWPIDLPLERQIPEALMVVLSNTRKRLNFGVHNRRHGQLIVDAVTTAAPELNLRKQPAVFFASSPTSPLVLDKDSAEALAIGLEFGLVPILAPCPMSGGTSQFSVIGTVLQQTAEVLFMVTAVYALRPGAPVLWGGAGAAMDMSVGDVSYGGAERSLMMLANIDMANHFGLPCHSPSSSLDSCLLDAQCGAEKTWAYMTRVLSGAALGMAVGAITNGKAASAEAMVMDSDIIRCIKRLASGIDTGHLETAVAEIMEVEHGGNFMIANGTLELLHDEEEYFLPHTFNRAGTSAPSILERAHERVEEILTTRHSPVSDKTVGELERLLLS
jgi:trimethylamine--corrinoid protein Co-methyltransferase